MSGDDKLLLGNAIDLAPRPETTQVQFPVKFIIDLVNAKILSPRQGFFWIFKQVEPLEYDGPVPPKRGR